MNEELEQSNSEVTPETSSESQETTSSQDGEAAQVATPEQTKQETAQAVPYDRFQEVITQKNQFAEQAKSLEAKYAQLEAQLSKLSQPQSKTEEDKLIGRLKGIDPEFGGRIEEMWNRVNKIDTIDKRLNDYEQAQTREKAVSQINSLHEQNKVAPELRDLYNSQLDLLAMRGELKSLDQIPQVYKQIHESYTKMLDGVKRAERESYVTAKKADTKAPTSQPKGTPASPTSKPSYPKDREEALAQVAQRAVKLMKADKNV